MRVKDLYPLVVVPDVVAQRDWYGRHLGFSVAVDVDWFVYLTSPGDRPFGLSFMREGLDLGLPGFHTPMVRDPAGIWVDIVQQVDPDPGYFPKAARDEQDAALDETRG